MSDGRGTRSPMQIRAGELELGIYPTSAEMGVAAARDAAEALRSAVAGRGAARVVLATGNSQFPFVDALAGEDVPWDRVTAFHMDEYVGLPGDHPASFRRWIRERIEVPFRPARVEYIDGGAADPKAECARYEALLREGPLDLACMGIGENGHLAFNEPGDADFDDERLVRVITLQERSRSQQVGEGHFPDERSVPEQALTLTIPALVSARRVQVCVPERRKAAAVAATVNAEISPDCPATVLRRCRHARVYLDAEAAAGLDRPDRA